jgi:nucleoside-diphosphate-sugar epimerase
MATVNVLIAGCGYVGTALGVRLAAEGYTVWGLRRQPGCLPAGIQPFAADLTLPETLQGLPPALDIVVYAAGTEGASDTAYRQAYVEGIQHLLEALQRQRQRPRRILLTSSTSVYAQTQGEWVNETSPTHPEYYSGQRLLEGEQLLLGGPFPATVVRCAGIYGPGRRRLMDRLLQGQATFPEGESQYTNRIHRDDCVGVLRHLIRLARPESLYLGVDHRPVEQGALLRWLAAQLGAPPPQVATPETTAVRRSQSNKRCSNARLLAAGYTFRYPTYQHGYTALLAELGYGPLGR